MGMANGSGSFQGGMRNRGSMPGPGGPQGALSDGQLMPPGRATAPCHDLVPMPAENPYGNPMGGPGKGGYGGDMAMMQYGQNPHAGPNPYGGMGMQGGPMGMPGMHQQHQQQEIQELKHGMHTVLQRMESQTLQFQQQMGRPQPIIIQNHAQSTTEQKMEAPEAAPKKDDDDRKIVGIHSFLFDMYWDLKKFFRSPFNRFCLMGSVGFGFYMYQQHLNHQWRMSEMQRRIDANLVLKMSQWVSAQMGQMQ